MSVDTHELPRAYGSAAMSGVIRAQASDFRVEELHGFEPDGQGEHVVLDIEKTGENTEWVARELARYCELPRSAISFAGMKDRHAVTRQRFSLHMPGAESPDFSSWPHPQVRILAIDRHSRKLRRGVLAGNRFQLRLTSLEGDRDQFEQRLKQISQYGVPNYFGEQRFGREGDNVSEARKLLAGSLRLRDRHRRGLLLSAARSQLFNAVLAQRVLDSTWDRLLPGEVVMLSGSRSLFVAEQLDATLEQRCREGDVHPSGPMWGKGETMAVAEAARVEASVLESEPELCAGLVKAGLEMQRRPLRLAVSSMSWSDDESGNVTVGFELPAGSYATVVVRELLQLR